jgi:8-oxo-dGTP pyrophosphatase MutT (NUDIX family)
MKKEEADGRRQAADARRQTADGGRQAAEGGRQKTGRTRKPHDETSAGGVVFRRDGADVLFLVIRDSYENWGFPKGHVEHGERPAAAALREVGEETGLAQLEVRAPVETIDWHFRFRGRPIHKVCHFFLMETRASRTTPQSAEGITACRWVRYDDAMRLLSYPNARKVLEHARALVREAVEEPAASPTAAPDASATARSL